MNRKNEGLTAVLKTDKVKDLLKKLKMSCVGGNWRLNEVTKAQKELFKALKIKLP